MSSFVQADGNLLVWIQHTFVNDAFTPAVKFITMFGEAGIFWIALCVLLLCFRRTRKLGLLAGLSLLLCFICCNLIVKPIVDRTRPWVIFEEVVRLVPDPGDPSFPSGHSANSMATAFAILLNSARCGVKRYWGVILVILAVLIALSRLYLGVHFPSDVLVGILFGILSAVIVYYASKYYESRKMKKL